MSIDNYEKMYDKIFSILKDYTPLTVDCGVLCNKACCKGDKNTGMLLFPHEVSTLTVKATQNGGRLAVCGGKCNRENRPLACRIFPFFPTVDEKGKVFVELDTRAYKVCPILSHSDELLFDPKFLKAVKKVGKILAKDEECLEFLKTSTDEIDMFSKFIL